MNDATSGDWSSITSTGTHGLENGSRAPGGSVYTYANSTFYALGGGTPDYQSAIREFLIYDGTAGTWTNDSSKYATSTGYWSLAAAAAAAGFGSAGHLVFLRGTSSETDPGVTTSTQLMDPSIITLYDLASGVCTRSLRPGAYFSKGRPFAPCLLRRQTHSRFSCMVAPSTRQ